MSHHRRLARAGAAGVAAITAVTLFAGPPLASADPAPAPAPAPNDPLAAIMPAIDIAMPTQQQVDEFFAAVSDVVDAAANVAPSIADFLLDPNKDTGRGLARAFLSEIPNPEQRDAALANFDRAYEALSGVERRLVSHETAYRTALATEGDYGHNTLRAKQLGLESQVDVINAANNGDTEAADALTPNSLERQEEATPLHSGARPITRPENGVLDNAAGTDSGSSDDKGAAGGESGTEKEAAGGGNESSRSGGSGAVPIKPGATNERQGPPGSGAITFGDNNDADNNDADSTEGTSDDDAPGDGADTDTEGTDGQDGPTEDDAENYGLTLEDYMPNEPAAKERFEQYLGYIEREESADRFIELAETAVEKLDEDELEEYYRAVYFHEKIHSGNIDTDGHNIALRTESGHHFGNISDEWRRIERQHKSDAENRENLPRVREFLNQPDTPEPLPTPNVEEGDPRYEYEQARYWYASAIHDLAYIVERYEEAKSLPEVEDENGEELTPADDMLQLAEDYRGGVEIAWRQYAQAREQAIAEGIDVDDPPSLLDEDGNIIGKSLWTDRNGGDDTPMAGHAGTYELQAAAMSQFAEHANTKNAKAGGLNAPTCQAAAGARYAAMARDAEATFVLVPPEQSDGAEFPGWELVFMDPMSAPDRDVNVFDEFPDSFKQQGRDKSCELDTDETKKLYERFSSLKSGD